MKKVIGICLLFATCSVQHLKAFTDTLTNLKFDVHFDYNLYQLNTRAKIQLDSLLFFMKHDSLPIRKIEIYGYCDSVGSNQYNDALSLKRAHEVGAYMVSKGFDDPLIAGVKGFGKRMPLNDNGTATDRGENRRVEILIRLKALSKAEPKTDLVVAKTAQSLPDSPVLATIDLSHAQVNDIIQLPDINFFPDRHMVVDASIKALHILLNTMRVNKTLRIEIRGHVCCLPDYQGDAFDEDTYTETLSLQRAKIIYLYLTERGIAPDRMTYIGLGAKYPLVKEFTELDRARNRRVEIRILSK